MDRQHLLKELQKEVMEKAAAHLAAVNRLPDEGEPAPELLADAHRTKDAWQEAMVRFNQLLEEMMKE